MSLFKIFLLKVRILVIMVDQRSNISISDTDLSIHLLIAAMIDGHIVSSYLMMNAACPLVMT